MTLAVKIDFDGDLLETDSDSVEEIEISQKADRTVLTLKYQPGKGPRWSEKKE